MGLGRLLDARLGLGVLVAAIVATSLPAGGVAAAARAGDACQRYGDLMPSELGNRRASAAVTCLINRKRRANGRGGLDEDRRLVEAASGHSSVMARQNCFSHECHGERGVRGRLKAVDYLVPGLSRFAYGENIGYGTYVVGTPREIVSAWMSSGDHRAFILSRTFRDVGAGFAKAGAAGFYTADFGLREK